MLSPYFSVHARYHFTCECSACLNDWQQCTKLPRNVKGLSNTAYKDKSMVNKLASMLKTKEKMTKRRDISSSEKLRICIECMKLADATLKRPHGLLCQVENDLHRHLFAFHSDINL